ncbi:cAMP-regulated D2 protein [Lingula anatina]|uniref:Carboxylic ester hydrolase n=1 Tax=Lingula anatina TaxID=7574 RepID=A0A1S3JSV7_LINAN|nr:cAMP-regulated D2 protein [Lingula anatina]|eukprot:XP_013413119.1 cAMP-regulated D2 protein [Lingula anatina]
MQKTSRYLFLCALIVNIDHLVSVRNPRPTLRFTFTKNDEKPKGPVVVTTEGPLQGIYRGASKVFYGIPFAEPPVGNLRWRPPQFKSSWHASGKTLLADVVPPACPQTSCLWHSPPFICVNKTSEDCLTLNIFTPSGASYFSNLPVMFFIHGGQFTTMSGGSPLWNGETLASMENVVVVTINYRLGALGFLFADEGPDAPQGNYGVMDQRFALAWVQRNIRNFGGNPDEVTIFGQSAGAQSVALHMTSAKSSSLFRRAIVESSPFAIHFKSHSEAKRLGKYLIQALGCQHDVVNCLRNASADALVTAENVVSVKVASLQVLEFFEQWGPFIDGVEVKDQPLDAFMSGNFQRKPIMMGVTTQEAQSFVYAGFLHNVSETEYRAILLATFPVHIRSVLSTYPIVSSGDQRPAFVNISTDYAFICPTRAAAKAIARRSFLFPYIWMYVFNQTVAPRFWSNITYCYGHVCHGSELPFVFNPGNNKGFELSKEEQKLSHAMQKYWANFARTGNPNTLYPAGANPRQGFNDGVTRMKFYDKYWPPFHSQTNFSVLEFKAPMGSVMYDFKTKLCDFWDGIGY